MFTNEKKGASLYSKQILWRKSAKEESNVKEGEFFNWEAQATSKECRSSIPSSKNHEIKTLSSIKGGIENKREAVLLVQGVTLWISLRIFNILSMKT